MPDPASSSGVTPGTAVASFETSIRAPAPFTWQYTYKLDPQKRVAFPSEWRPTDPQILFTLVLWPHAGAERKFGYINGLSQRRFQELLAKLEKSGLGDARAGALRRAIFGNSHTLPLDVAGRLVLPARMAEAIGLQKEVLFVGAGAEFQIWDPDLYEKCTAAEAPLAADAYTQLV
ncbi:MAG TPA: hypothetical protein PLX89_23625 [Verrucomicrobiota bacterium]|nr:hypothetical protein [Verrucomicrobiota bacterium]